jgi:hypothetical protein
LAGNTNRHSWTFKRGISNANRTFILDGDALRNNAIPVVFPGRNRCERDQRENQPWAKRSNGTAIALWAVFVREVPFWLNA